MYTFKTKGTCAREIKLKINEKKIIEKVEFIGGCDGNLIGLASMVEGQPVDLVVEKLSGIICRNGTSCPDQLTKALKQIS